MDGEILSKTPHVLVLPYPAQGHINPVLAFSKCLASKGLRVTIIATSSVKINAKSKNQTDSEDTEKSSINIATISDGSEDMKEREDIEGYCKRIRAVISKSLAKFIDELKGSAKIIVYDSTMPWVLDIAHEKGLLGASFFTTCCSVSAVFYHLGRGFIKYPYEDSTVSLCSLPMLEMNDLPCFSKFNDPKDIIFKHLVNQFSNLEKVDWIFVNTFDNLENEVIEWMKANLPIKTIGPTILLETSKKFASDKNQMIGIFEQNYEASTYKWLDSKETGSVVYVSLGSVASIGKEEMEELAYGLMMSNYNFLWVVRASEQNKLPQNFNSSEKGLIVNWCSQTEVLAHRSVACFMTHGGWNSTLEALCFGVPLITLAQWVDQQTNAKLVEDVWEVGIRVRGAENGIIKRKEIAECIEEAIEGDKRNELRRNAEKWKKLAKEAVGIHGSSTKNIEDFVTQLLCTS